ncbi:ribonuclease H-like domain-containing protein [Hypoxylon sp. FL1150]|nr:ribonuclease H-like domain-containing protein [Hypoxylon sp. FL1150]
MDDTRKPPSKFDRDKAQWPLAYSLKPPKAGDPPRKVWDFSYYRGPRDRPAQVLYADSLSRSESLARIFLDEPVVGFDMEWPMFADRSKRVQDKVSLIQIAAERKIGLFHIALHEGQTTNEVIAPSLRRIIESATIIKTGVKILGADFKRLKDHLHLQPRGALELSYLHHLVLSDASTRLCALSKQVEHHLGLPLDKGSVRTSNWSLPLSDAQRKYAANDAYAGFMLFHCMNSKRLAMSPVSPLPKLVELTLSPEMPQISLAQPKPTSRETHNAVAIVKPSVAPHSAAPTVGHGDSNKEVATLQPTKEKDNRVNGRAREARGPLAPKSSGPRMSSRLYAKLKLHRKYTALEKDVAAYIVAPNKVLEGLATHRPVDRSQLLKIHGIGKCKADEYGDEWLEIIAEDLAEDSPQPTRKPLQATDPNRGNTTLSAPKHSIGDDDIFYSKRVRITNVRRSKEIRIYEPPQNTGLSFQFADTRLDTTEASGEKG